jgi:hypothetical protein
MASIINATTSTGLVSSADNSGSLQLATNNGTTAVTIDTSQKVGIGTTSPATKLHVSGGARVADSGNAANYMTFGVGTNASYGNASISTTTAGLSIVAEGAGNMTFLNNGSERMRIDSVGGVFIGTTTNANNGAMIVQQASNGTGITVNGVNNTSGAVFMYFTEAGANCGYIQRVGTTGSVVYSTSSDYRLKENIAPITGALATVAKLKPVTYDWKAGGSSQGFIAHELQEFIPDAVTGVKDQLNEDGSINAQGIDQSRIVATLTAAIQELNAKVDAQAVRIAELEGAK